MKKVFILLLIFGLLVFASFGECAPQKSVPIGMAVEFMDHANAKVPIKIVAGTHKYDYDLVEVKCGDISLVVSSEREKIKKVAILPEDIYLSDTRPPGPDVNRVKGKLSETNESSSTVCCTVITGKNSLKVKLPREIFVSMSLNTGDEVWLILALRKLKIITDGG